MRPFFLSAIGLLAFGSSAIAQTIDVEPTNIERSERYFDVTFAVTNETSDSFRAVIVECTFFDESNKALKVDSHTVTNVPASSTVHNTMKSRATDDMHSVTCRVASTL